MNPEELAMAIMKRDPMVRPEVAHQLALQMINPNRPGKTTPYPDGSASAYFDAVAKGTAPSQWDGPSGEATRNRVSPPAYLAQRFADLPQLHSAQPFSQPMNSAGAVVDDKSFTGPAYGAADEGALDFARDALSAESVRDLGRDANDAIVKPVLAPVQLPRGEREQALELLKKRDQMIRAGGGNVPPQDETELKRQRVARYHELMAKHYSGQAVSEQDRAWLDKVHAASKGQ